jgi:hypothetical protein
MSTFFVKHIEVLMRVSVQQSMFFTLLKVSGIAPAFSLYRTDSNGFHETVLNIGLYELRIGLYSDNPGLFTDVTLSTDIWYDLNRWYDDLSSLAVGDTTNWYKNYHENWERLTRLPYNLYRILDDAPAWANTSHPAKIFWIVASMASKYQVIFDEHDYKVIGM